MTRHTESYNNIETIYNRYKKTEEQLMVQGLTWPNYNRVQAPGLGSFAGE